MKKVSLIFVTVFVVTLGFGQDGQNLTDPEIASIALTANQIDVDYGKIALKKSKDDAAIEFANTMIKDHSAIIDQATALANKLGVTPKDNDVTQSLLAGAKKMKKELQHASKKDFNKMYIDNEVAYHKAVIKTVKEVLIPQTSNPELKALLQTALPILETHLKHAEMAQSNIDK